VSDCAWAPQIGPQSDACAAAEWCQELLYGGAGFGGKTDFLLGDWASAGGQGPVWVGILFRRTFPELEEIIERSRELYTPMRAEWSAGTKTWRWPSGALLRLRSLDVLDDFWKYLGFSYSWIGWDELPQMETMGPYHRMKSRLRGPARSKRIRATGNPGGRCHGEVKAYWGIDRWPGGYHPIVDPLTHMTRCFIPARVRDNRIGLAADPGYIARLSGVGDPELVSAWADGNWDAVVGSYFSMLRASEATVVAKRKRDELDAVMLRECRAEIAKLREWPRCVAGDHAIPLTSAIRADSSGMVTAGLSCQHGEVRAFRVQLSPRAHRMMGAALVWEAP